MDNILYGGMIGMLIPSVAVAALVPVGTKLPAWGIAAHIANYFATVVDGWVTMR